MDALDAYGGASDLEVVNGYIQHAIENKQQRNDKIDQLFIEAFKFIDAPDHWNIINALAAHIIHTTKAVIPCEEVMEVIDNALYGSKPTVLTWLDR
ncbi:MAG: hypothetical protein Q8N96_02405 [Methylovulum sp.]|nr:hypothetical protein [Methylovulum sp.]